MVRKCAALFCRSGYDATKKYEENDSSNLSKRHVYCFPKGNKSRRKWVEAVRRPKLREDNCRYSGVCELHFRPEDFSDGAGLKQRRRLKRGAVPSVFGRETQGRHPRSTSLATPTARRSHDQQTLESQAEAFFLADRIAGLDELKERLLSERIPSGFR